MRKDLMTVEQKKKMKEMGISNSVLNYRMWVKGESLEEALSYKNFYSGESHIIKGIEITSEEVAKAYEDHELELHHIKNRLYNGWSKEKALNHPLDKRKVFIKETKKEFIETLGRIKYMQKYIEIQPTSPMMKRMKKEGIKFEDVPEIEVDMSYLKEGAELDGEKVDRRRSELLEG